MLLSYTLFSFIHVFKGFAHGQGTACTQIKAKEDTKEATKKATKNKGFYPEEMFTA
jgi:hypothetical protein